MNLHRSSSLAEAETWLALSGGALLLLMGASRRSKAGTMLAASSAPLLYRGFTGQWPSLSGSAHAEDTRVALSGNRGVHVRESIRLEVPRSEVYAFWRRLENLPTFMAHLDNVTNTSDRSSHWVATGPAGLRVEWDAEIINEVGNSLIAWRSIPGSDIVTAGSVKFEDARAGRSTEVTVHLQYAPPGGKAGALLASLFGREPSQAIREDLRRLKQLLEAGEIPRATASE